MQLTGIMKDGTTTSDTVKLNAIPHPLRARHAGTDPVHAVRSILAGGHNTACLTWLSPKDHHQWLPGDTPVTCTKCIQRATEK